MKIMNFTICYGKSMESIATDLGVTKEKAQEIYDSVLRNIPGLKNFMDESQQMATERGFVETKWGRRRHIPDMQLPQYEIKSVGTKNFDPFFDSEELGVIDDTERLKQQYLNDMINAKYYKQKLAIKEKAEKDGFKIKDNTKFIQDATRQCVNCVDDKTEILTKDGWKTVYDLTDTDIVLTINPNTGLSEWNNIQCINKYNGVFDCIRFKSNAIDVISTKNHRWLVDHRSKLQFLTTQELADKCGSNWTDYTILRSADNNFNEADYPDWFLKLVGLFLTDGSIGLTSNEVRIYQSLASNPEKCAKIDAVFNEAKIVYTKNIKEKTQYVTWRFAYEVGGKIRRLFPNRTLTPEFICSLSQRQANILVEYMMLGDGMYDSRWKSGTIITSTLEKCNMFQMLCFVAGISTNAKEVNNIGRKTFCNKSNSWIECKHLYYIVRLLKRSKIHIYNHHITQEQCNFVWCPTVKNGTWVARRNFEVFITGNSRVQGSAADQSKIAIKLIGQNERMKQLGWRTMLLVHDEIIGECPIQYAKECGDLLVQSMLASANDLRTGAACDASYVLRWYGDEINLEDLPTF